MRLPNRRSRIATAIALALVLGAVLGAAATSAADRPARIVAIGDIHGAYEPFVEILQQTRLIDRDLNWIGGDTLFVQTGDFTDKGPDVRQVMDLLISLQVHAPKTGGRVLILMGNHEAMNLMGLNRDADPAAYRQFVDEKSEKRRTKAYKAHVRLTRKRVSRLGMEKVTFDDSTEKAWMEAHPPGLVEYLEAMSSNGIYGKWIRTLPIVATIDDLLFIHAGIGPEQAALSADEINRMVANDILQFDAARDELIQLQVVLPSYTWTEMEQAIVTEFNGYRERAERDQGLLDEDRQHMVRLAEILDFRGGSLIAGQGPLWYRGFARWSDEEGGASIDQLSAKHGVDRFFSGHTPSPGGEIRVRFDHRVFLIDTGMLKKVYDGVASALVIEDGRITAIYPDGEQVLFAPDASDG